MIESFVEDVAAEFAEEFVEKFTATIKKQELISK
jgi:hypothetical protein